MKKTKKALASLAIAGMVLTMVPFNAFANDTVVNRLAGTTAAETAVAIADQTGWTGTAILASSASYGMVDALTSGPLAKALNAPILLQEPGATLNADTKAELIKLQVKKVYVTSGTAVINQAVLDTLSGMDIEVVKLGGADRFETSVNIAKEMVKLGTVTKVAVAYGWLNQDALSIASIASYANQPILLTEKNTIPASVKAFLAANTGVVATDVIGGTGVISNTVKDALPNATRHAGMTAYDTNNQVIQDFASSLEFDKVYVANAITGIDALAGAPLAAQTKSAIVLTDGVNSPSVAVFTHSQSSASTVVTALGGQAVVPEAVRLKIAAGQVDNVVGELAIVSVSALTDDGHVLAVAFSKAFTGTLDKSMVAIFASDSLARVGVESVELASNGLTAEIMLYDNTSENATDEIVRLKNYTIKIGALSFEFARPMYADQDDNARITAVDATEREITLESKYGKTVLEVPATMKVNFQQLLGQNVRVWWNADDEVVNMEIQSEFFNQAIEFDLGDEEITLVDSDETLDLADDYEFFLNDDSADLGDDAIDDGYDFAKVILNKDGDVAYIYAYNWDEYMVVEEVNDYVAMSYDNSELDLEDYIIVKDGLQIANSDIEKGDILYFNTDAKDGDGYAVVYNNSVSGEITDVFLNEIRIDGKTYNYAGMKYDKATQYLDGDSFEAVDSDVAEEFQAGGDVTLFLDHKGDAVYLTGAQDVVASNDLGFALTEDVVYYDQSGVAGRGMIELEGVNGNGEEKLYTFRVDTLDTIGDFEVGEPFAVGSADIDKFVLSGADIVAVDEDGGLLGTVATDLDALAEDNDFIEITLDDEGTINGLSFLTEKTFHATTNALELDDKFINGFKLDSNTVVFDGSSGWDTSYTPAADDINVTTWGDLADEGFKVFDASYYTNSDNEVDYLVIKNSDAEDTTDYNAVVTKVLKNTDSEIVELTVLLDGVKKVYKVDEVKDNAVVKGSIVKLGVNDGDTSMVEDVDVVGMQGVVSNVSVSERTVRITGDFAETYSLVSDGSVINSKDTGDIKVKALRDIKTGDTVKVSRDEGVTSGPFIDVVNIVDPGTVIVTPPVVTTGAVVTYINSADATILVDGEVYEIGATTVLYNLGGIEVVAVGKTDILGNGTTGALRITDEVKDIVVENGVVKSMTAAKALTSIENDNATKASDVDTLIEALPAAASVATTDKTDIEAARTAFNALTDAQEALVKAANVTALEDAEAALEVAVAVKAVNDAATVTPMMTAIEDAGLGLDLTAYNALLGAQKQVVAQYLIDNRSYVSVDAIQAELDAAI